LVKGDAEKEGGRREVRRKRKNEEEGRQRGRGTHESTTLCTSGVSVGWAPTRDGLNVARNTRTHTFSLHSEHAADEKRTEEGEPKMMIGREERTLTDNSKAGRRRQERWRKKGDMVDVCNSSCMGVLARKQKKWQPPLPD